MIIFAALELPLTLLKSSCSYAICFQCCRVDVYHDDARHNDDTVMLLLNDRPVSAEESLSLYVTKSPVCLQTLNHVVQSQHCATYSICSV
jgi:hypothetical protein